MVDIPAPPPAYLDASLLKAPSPSYSAEPLAGEKSISYRPRHGLQMLRTSQDDAFIRKFDSSTTVVLKGQMQSTEVLSYGRRGLISGSLDFSDSSLITAVSLEVKGRIELSTALGYRNIAFLSDSIPVYDRSQLSGCQASVPFLYCLPQRVNVQEKEYDLPPSYTNSYGNPGDKESMKVEYTMTFVVTKMLHRRTPMLTSTKRLALPFDYVLRTRPSRPLLDLDADMPFRTTLKGCPEEWREFVHDVTVAKSLDPIVCQMYLPSVGAFAIQDTIPFFLQMTGRSSSLQMLRSQSEGEVGVRVTVLRQIVMELVVTGKVPRHFTIGHAKLEAIPPALSQEENLNWQGTLTIDNDIKNGRFQAPHMAVQDFVLLEITLPDGSVVKNGHPISLATDSWSEASFTPGSWI